MSYKVTFTNPTFAKGKEFAVGNYFLAINGEAVEVSDEVAARYKSRTGRTLKEGLGKKFKVETVSDKAEKADKVEGGDKE